MKTTKIVSLILALCMLLSFGAISAAAEEAPAEVGVVSGGWEFSNIGADNCTAAEKEILTNALAETMGVTYDPKDVIAKQVVSGTNYAFLCLATPVVPNAESHWAVVTVYVDLQGNASLVNIADIDPANPSLTDSSNAGGSGAWQSEAKEPGSPLPTAVYDALENNVGLHLDSIAILATQVVAGTNYRILCYGTLVTAEPKTDLYIVDVNVDIDEEAHILKIDGFDLLSYVTPPVVEDPTEEPTETPTEAATEPGEKSPKTGTGSASALAILLVMFALAGAGVSVYALGKKRG